MCGSDWRDVSRLCEGRRVQVQVLGICCRQFGTTLLDQLHPFASAMLLLDMLKAASRYVNRLVLITADSKMPRTCYKALLGQQEAASSSRRDDRFDTNACRLMCMLGQEPRTVH